MQGAKENENKETLNEMNFLCLCANGSSYAMRSICRRNNI